MGQITKNHPFQPYQDLMYKASIFKLQLEEMERVSFDMLAMIDHELETSSGRIVEETMNSLKQHHQKEQSMIHHNMLMTGTLAAQYQAHINDMNIQRITIYYEEKD
jgi:hypothetical protein